MIVSRPLSPRTEEWLKQKMLDAPLTDEILKIESDIDDMPKQTYTENEVIWLQVNQ